MLKKETIFLTFFLLNNLYCNTYSQNVSIEDNFTFCDTNNLNRLFNHDLNCRSQLDHQYGTYLRKTFPNVLILAKNEYVINDYGYQCSKKRIVRFMNETFFGEVSEKIVKEIIELSRLECLVMIDSKECEKNPMQCDSDGCSFSKVPEGDFDWFTDKKLISYECEFHKKLIIGKSSEVSLFGHNKSTCTVHDLYCKLYDSVVIWKKDIVFDFPFLIIHQGKDYMNKNNLIFSFRDNFLFEIINTTTFNNSISLYETTDELFVYAEENSGNYAFLIKTLPNSKNHSNLLVQKDLSGLLVADEDFKLRHISKNIEKGQREYLFKNCVLFLNQLKLLANEEEKLSEISDLNGNKFIVYSKYNKLFLPNCKKVSSISLVIGTSNTDECFEDMPVSFILDKNRTLNGYLTDNNFLKIFSKSQPCDLINKRYLLPSMKNTIVRLKKETNLFNVSNLIVENFHISYVNLSYVNFKHSDSIFQDVDYQINQQKLNEQNDIDGNFDHVPDDQVDLSNQIIENVFVFKKQLESKIHLVYVFLKCCLYFFILLMVFYGLKKIFVCFKLAEFFNKQSNARNQMLPQLTNDEVEKFEKHFF